MIHIGVDLENYRLTLKRNVYS